MAELVFTRALFDELLNEIDLEGEKPKETFSLRELVFASYKGLSNIIKNQGYKGVIALFERRGIPIKLKTLQQYLFQYRSQFKQSLDSTSAAESVDLAALPNPLASSPTHPPVPLTATAGEVVLSEVVLSEVVQPDCIPALVTNQSSLVTNQSSLVTNQSSLVTNELTNANQVTNEAVVTNSNKVTNANKVTNEAVVTIPSSAAASVLPSLEATITPKPVGMGGNTSVNPYAVDSGISFFAPSPTADVIHQPPTDVIPQDRVNQAVIPQAVIPQAGETGRGEEGERCKAEGGVAAITPELGEACVKSIEDGHPKEGNLPPLGALRADSLPPLATSVPSLPGEVVMDGSQHKPKIAQPKLEDKVKAASSQTGGPAYVGWRPPNRQGFPLSSNTKS